MSLTNPNTPVSQQDLQDFYHRILPYLGGIPEILANKFSKSDLYSTYEKMIGQWIDGKPLYQRTITIDDPALTVGDKTHVYEKYWALNTSVDIPVSIDCMEMQKTLNKWGRIPLTYTIDGDANMRPMWIYEVFNGNTATSNPNSIGVCWNGDASWIEKLAFTIKYTKTTDSPIVIGNDTDYSTEEKIIGTWINGKPIYQKTIDFGALPNNTSKTINHGISNIDRVIYLYGIELSNDSVYWTAHLPNGGSVDTTSLYANRTQIFVETLKNKSDRTAYVTLQYTKTTD